MTVYGAAGLLGGFHADKQSLNTAARDVYVQLEKLSTWAEDVSLERDRRFKVPLSNEGFEFCCADLFHPFCRDGVTKSPAWPQWRPWVEGKVAERTELLEGLKQVGQDLYEAVFRDSGAPIPVTRLRTTMQRAYEHHHSDRRIIIQPHAELRIPWGLLFDPAHEPGEDPSTDEASHYGGFWALRYDLSVTSHTAQPWRPEGRSVDFGVLSLIEEAMEKLVKDDLGEAGHDELFNRPPIGTVHSLNDCKRRLNGGGLHQIDVLLHFLGHQRDQQLLLGPERINYDKFFGLVSDIALPAELRRDGSYGLVFINGCRTAQGQDECSLQSAVDEVPDLCGAIATEGAVRRPFAAEFARRFIKLLKEGSTISAAMRSLRRAPDLWPESLLYGCYASPDYCITRPVAATA